MKTEYVGPTKQPRYTIEEGDRFGKLTVVCMSGKTDDNRKYYLCECDCGNKVIVSQQALLNENTKSCGCVVRKEGIIMSTQKKHTELCTHCHEKPYYAKGLCRNCYARFYRKGTPEKNPKKPPVVHDTRIRKRAYLAEELVPVKERERIVVEGLKRNMTYAEIGEEFGVSRQRVDQIIRTMCRRQFLEGFKKEDEDNDE